MTYSRSITAVVLLTLLVGIEGVLCLQLQCSYNDLGSLYGELEGEFISLQNKHSELVNQYEGLGEEYVSIRAHHQDLTQDYGNLQGKYSAFMEYVSLQGDYEKEREYIIKREAYVSLLRESYVKLQRNYEIETTLRIGNSLESFYDFLRYEKGFTGLGWSDHQREADFAAQLALHDLGRNCWPSLENAYYQDVGERSYETAKEKIDEVIGLIELEFFHTPTFKIESILQFIHQNIHSEKEVNNVYLAPTETLGFKSGDCDDFSILASALFEAVGIDSAFGIFRNEDNEYHCAVLVHLQQLKDYGWCSYSDLTDFGLDKGTWIVIEPQHTIDHQDSDTIGELTLVAASSLDQ